MTRKHIEWFCIIGNIVAIVIGLLTQDPFNYIYVAAVPNGCMFGMLFVEHRESKKRNKDAGKKYNR